MRIYVDLPDEATATWCPVEAEPLGGDVYRIVGVNDDPVDTRWAFNTGAIVKCKWIDNMSVTEMRNTEILVAYEEVPVFRSTNI